MMIRRKRIQLAPRDFRRWRRAYESHPEPHYRRRLWALRYLWEGYQMKEVCMMVNCNIKTLRTWVDCYLEGGYDRLLAPIRRPKKQQLDINRKRILRHILVNKRPVDYGYRDHVWNVPLVEKLLTDKWEVNLKKSRIYEVLHEIKVDLKSLPHAV